jgi:2-keto-4-pentenoate hydratase
MAVTGESELVQLLVDAQRQGDKATLVDPEKLAHIDLDSGYRISLAQRDALGETVGMYKSMILKDGVGVAGPIFSSRIGHSPDYKFPAGLSIKGVEYEVGIELARDIAPDENLDEESFDEAVSHYFLGIEVVGTRLAPAKDGEKPSIPVQLADHFSALGYVIGAKVPKDIDVSGGLTVALELNGKEFHRQVGVQPFGTVVASAVAYAKSQHPGMPLKAGTRVTTGALSGCVLLPEGTKGVVVGRLGNEEPVQFVLQ